MVKHQLNKQNILQWNTHIHTHHQIARHIYKYLYRPHCYLLNANAIAIMSIHRLVRACVPIECKLTLSWIMKCTSVHMYVLIQCIPSLHLRRNYLGHYSFALRNPPRALITTAYISISSSYIQQPSAIMFRTYDVSALISFCICAVSVTTTL